MFYQTGNWWSGWVCCANEKKSAVNRQPGHAIKVADGDLVAWWEKQRASGVRHVEDRRRDRDDMGVLSSHTGKDED